MDRELGCNTSTNLMSKSRVFTLIMYIRNKWNRLEHKLIFGIPSFVGQSSCDYSLSLLSLPMIDDP